MSTPELSRVELLALRRAARGSTISKAVMELLATKDLITLRYEGSKPHVETVTDLGAQALKEAA